MTRAWVTIALAGLLIAACGGGSDQATVDTVMVFTATPPAAPSPQSLMEALNAYHQKRISADSAAVIIVDHIKAGRSVNAQFDAALMRAVKREMESRERSN